MVCGNPGKAESMVAKVEGLTIQPVSFYIYHLFGFFVGSFSFLLPSGVGGGAIETFLEMA